MSTKPLVAIITRTKDRPLLLERAIKSVGSQTFTDYVMVIVNDGGDPAVVDRLVKKHQTLLKDRVKVIHNKTSLGMQAASNKAIKDSQSEFVVVHDDDDSWHPDFLQKTTDYLLETKAKGVVVVTDKIIEEVTKDTVKTISRERLFPDLKFINIYKMCWENYATPISFIYRREVFKTVGYYDESLGGVGDWDFGLRFLLHYDVEFLNTKNALAYYHHRPQATGVNSNSVFTDTHRSLENVIANRYLRQDLVAGKLGLGYIINAQRHDFEVEQRIRHEVHQGRLDDREYLKTMLAQSEARVAQLEALLKQYIQESSPLGIMSSSRRVLRKTKRKLRG